MTLSVEASDILEDHNLTIESSDDEIDDIVWDVLRCDCLGVDYSATWSSGCKFDGNPDTFKVWLTVGGPSCYITGDFGKHGIPDSDSLRVWFSWASDPDFIWLEPNEKEAIGWYVEQVAV
ncbi:MAG: hypothetical protein VXX44_01105 [Bacteroidota bacterium]|nr:hypothetical protein [Bacteroidota bacterium]